MSLKLVQTCGACPEQYDVFKDATLVGYLRLRHGHFRAHYKGVSGPIVYEANTEGDGEFSDFERKYHLEKAKLAIQREIDQCQQ